VRKHLSLLFILTCVLTSCLFAQDSAQSDSQPTNIAGKWQMSWQGRDGAKQATLQLQQDGSKLTGTLDGDRGSVPITGSVNGNNISFSTQSQGRRNFSMVYTGTVDGDKITGSVQPQAGQGGGEGGMAGGGHRGGGQQNHSRTATRQAANPSGQGASSNDDQSDDPQPGF
jgi:hypothetical protein